MDVLQLEITQKYNNQPVNWATQFWDPPPDMDVFPTELKSFEEFQDHIFQTPHSGVYINLIFSPMKWQWKNVEVFGTKIIPPCQNYSCHIWN